MAYGKCLSDKPSIDALNHPSVCFGALTHHLCRNRPVTRRPINVLHCLRSQQDAIVVIRKRRLIVIVQGSNLFLCSTDMLPVLARLAAV